MPSDLWQRPSDARLSQFDPYFQNLSTACFSQFALPLKKPAL